MADIQVDEEGRGYEWRKDEERLPNHQSLHHFQKKSPLSREVHRELDSGLGNNLSEHARGLFDPRKPQ